MRIIGLLAEDMHSALALWLTSLSHQLTNLSEPPRQWPQAERLIVNHQQLQNLDPTNCPIAPQNWLLLDSQLSTTQSIQALQKGCGYISTAPLDKRILNNWLQGQQPLPNMLDVSNLDATISETAPLLNQFIDIVTNDLITKGTWTTELQEQAKQLIPLRDASLQLPQFKHLNAEGKLSLLQQAQLACHTLAGAELLKQNNQALAAQIALQHHEHFDGSGYPQQLKGDAIHPIARLAKLYDAYTGLRKEKVYAKALDHETSMHKLQFGDGYLWPGQFDGELLRSLVNRKDIVAELFN